MTEDSPKPVAEGSASQNAEEKSDSAEVRVVDKRWWARADGNSGSDEPRRSSKPTYVEELERQLADKDEQLRTYAARYKEAAEEFEETRVRLRREIAKDVDREKRRVLASFLDVVDNLERAVEAARSAADDAIVQGVEMVRQQFLGTLHGHGISRIEAVGEAFDPNQHDAISTVAVESVEQHEIVVDVVKLGYRVGDEVLRPAGVVVGKHDHGDTAEPSK